MTRYPLAVRSGFNDLQYLICRDIGKLLHGTLGPSDCYSVCLAVPTQAKVNPLVILGVTVDATALVSYLGDATGFQLDFRADGIAV